MPDESADPRERIAELTETIHALARERYKRRRDPPEPESASLSYRSLTRRTALVGLVGSLGAALLASPASADPAGTLQGTSAGDPLLEIRANQLVLVERSGAPAAPSSGRVVLYTEIGDL